MISKGTKGLFVLMDVDDFKTVNDNYGHDVGDLVIIAVADALKNTFRDIDVVFRLGGDEFAVYIPGVTDDDVRDYLVERIRSGIGRIDIPEMENRPVTASIGTSYFHSKEDDSFEELYQRADHKMYEEKRRKKS
jgi:diguanylate cyclase (GGDEF)-like protein